MKKDRSFRLAFPFAAFCCAGGLLLTACAPQQAMSPHAELNRLDRSLYDAAESFEERRDYTAAVSYYRNLHRRNADDAGAVVGLARGLRHLRQTREARAFILRALKKAPNNIDLRSELGKVQLALGKPLKAVDTLSRVDAELVAKRWDIKVALGIAHDRLEMYEQAERRYRQALELSPENAVVMNNLALSLAQAGRLDEAIEILDQASALPEATPRMRQNLALLYAMKGDLASAEQYVRRDLRPKIADHNMAYYRSLKAGATGAAAPAPSGPRKLAAQPVAPAPPPAKIAAAEAEPAKLGVKTATRIPGNQAAAKAKKTLKTAPAVAKSDAKPDTPPQVAPDMAAKPTAGPKPAPETMAAARMAEPAAREAMKQEPTAGKAGNPPEKTEVKAVALPRQDAAVAATNAKPDAETDAKTVMAVKAAANPESAPGSAAAVNTAEPASREAMKKQTTADRAADAAKKAAPKMASLGGFRLQLGSFRSLDGAKSMRDRIIADHGDILRGVELVVETVTVPERGDFFRVNSQLVPKRAGIDETCLKLAIRDVPCLLVRTP